MSRYFEAKEGYQCKSCGNFEFQHIPANPEDLENWECSKCGKDFYFPEQLDKVASQYY